MRNRAKSPSRRTTSPKGDVQLPLTSGKARSVAYDQDERPASPFWKWVGFFALIHLILLVSIGIFYAAKPKPPMPEPEKQFFSLLPKGTAVQGTSGETQSPTPKPVEPQPIAATPQPPPTRSEPQEVTPPTPTPPPPRPPEPVAVKPKPPVETPTPPKPPKPKPVPPPPKPKPKPKPEPPKPPKPVVKEVKPTPPVVKPPPEPVKPVVKEIAPPIPENLLPPPDPVPEKPKPEPVKPVVKEVVKPEPVKRDIKEEPVVKEKPAKPVAKEEPAKTTPKKPKAEPTPEKPKIVKLAKNDLQLTDAPDSESTEKPANKPTTTPKKDKPKSAPSEAPSADQDKPAAPEKPGPTAAEIAAKFGAKLQAAGVKDSVKVGTSGSLQSPKENPYAGFYVSVRNQVMNKWEHPNISDPTAINPVVTIHVEKDGRVPPEMVTLERSSGNKVYDDSAVAAAKSLGYTLQPLPDGCPPDIHINFNITR